MSIEENLSHYAIQQNIHNFVELLPKHVSGWKSALQECSAPVQTLLNQAEQLRHVENADIPLMEDFKAAQDNLQFYILRGIEEELATVKTMVAKMAKLNQDLKTKLLLLENSTVNIDWHDPSRLLSGTALQPSLSLLLSEGFCFFMFFNKALKNINERLKHMDVRNERSMSKLKESFSVDLDDKTVRYYLALTQYINNEDSVL